MLPHRLFGPLASSPTTVLVAALTFSVILVSPIQSHALAKDTPTPTTTTQDRHKGHHWLPMLHMSNVPYTLKAGVLLAARAEQVNAFITDSTGNQVNAQTAITPLARIWAKYDSKMSLIPLILRVNYEHDVQTGVLSPVKQAQGLPNQDLIINKLRRAHIFAALGPYANLLLGYDMSHWGMGLIANDGAHGWQPKTAQFTDPRDGDQVLRAMLGTGPLTPYKIVARMGIDRPVADDIMLGEKHYYKPQQPFNNAVVNIHQDPTLNSRVDEAIQYVAAVMVGYKQPTHAGIYIAHRRQSDGGNRDMKVTAIDFTAASELDLGTVGQLKLTTEMAYIFGTTSLAGTALYPDQTVQQLGASARASLDRGHYGAVIDFLYATGDRNTDDKSQNAFKTDRNYELGMLLYRYMLAGYTGQSVATASNPDLVGTPTQGLERFPTRGAASNSITWFPRMWWQPMHGIEVYGGALFAFSEVDMIDPFHTRVSGGEPRNVFNGKPGSYLGTELDLGLRMFAQHQGVRYSLGLEGAQLFPGSAFVNATGMSAKPIYGGRIITHLEF